MYKIALCKQACFRKQTWTTCLRQYFLALLGRAFNLRLTLLQRINHWNQKRRRYICIVFFFGLSDWTWTSGPLNPIQVLYQTELHPDIATLKLPIIYYQKHSEMSILNWFIMNIYDKIPYIINVLTIIFWFVIIIMETRLLWKVWKGECVVDCKRIWDE